MQDPSLFSMLQTVVCWRKRRDFVSGFLQFEKLEEQFLQFAVKLLYVSCKFAVLANQIIDISAVVLVSLVIRASGRVALSDFYPCLPGECPMLVNRRGRFSINLLAGSHAIFDG